LGRKCTFDDLEELTFISERTHERFFKKFILYGSTRLYDEWVVLPKTNEEIEWHAREMKLAGFPGAVASTDATHVIILNCRYGIRQVHLGFKLDKTSRTYNLSATHRRWIVSSTGGHPARWNDKTLQLFDDFLLGLQDGTLMNDYEFELLERDSNGEIICLKYKGAWVLVDNGYLDWSVTVPPFTCPLTFADIRFSQWLESMRKDVECTFGILKKRWTILSKGVQAQSIEDADRVWKTCCALHNFLLNVDGYDEMWEGEIPSQPDDDYTCFAIDRLNNPVMGPASQGAPCGSQTFQIPTPINQTAREVRKMDLKDFRMKLVEHFDILFHHHQIVWPTRVKPPRSI